MITKEEIKSIAELAKLAVREEEYPALISDLQQMVAFADEVRGAQLCVCEAEVQSTEETCFAQDQVSPSYSREELLANAPVSDKEFFVVGKRA